jgi:hypothetical protein
VAVLEVDPQVFDRLAFQLGQHAREHRIDQGLVGPGGRGRGGGGGGVGGQGGQGAGPLFEGDPWGHPVGRDVDGVDRLASPG